METRCRKAAALFLDATRGFRSLWELADGLASAGFVKEFQSPYLRRLCALREQADSESEGFSRISQTLASFEGVFDEAQAVESGVVVPHPGRDAAYDQIVAQIQQIEWYYSSSGD
jgi:hypothetical protein